MTVTFPYSSAPVRQIKEIQFGVMSPEDIVGPNSAINPSSQSPALGEDCIADRISGGEDPR